MGVCLSVLQRILRFVVYGTGIAAILLVSPKLFKIEPSIVLSGSMEPALRAGDVIYTKLNTDSVYQVGDIVVFRYEAASKPSAHRITAIDETVIHTKGDNNEYEDMAVITPEQIEGRGVCVVPKIGYVIQKAQTKKGIIALLSVICVNFLLGFMDLSPDEEFDTIIK